MEQIELEEFVFLQDLKAEDLAKRQIEAQEKAAKKAREKATRAAAAQKLKGRKPYGV